MDSESKEEKMMKTEWNLFSEGKGEEGEEEKEGKEAPKLVFRLEMAILKSFAITPQVRGVMKGSRLYRPQSLKFTG